MSSVQSLKSSLSSRVRTDMAEWQAASRIQGHSPYTCPAGSQNLRNTVTGVPANQNTLNMASAECNTSNPFIQTVVGRMMTENNERPYIPIGNAGHRGAGDLMGKSRDLMPIGLYGDGKLASFVRQGSEGLRLPEPSYIFDAQQPFAERRVQSLNLPSHDTSVSSFYVK